MGKSVPEVLSTARGRRPRGVPSPVTNMFIFSCSKLVLQITNGFLYATLAIESACAPSTNDLLKILATSE